MMPRWPGHPSIPKPRIPVSSEERVTAWDEEHRKTASEFWFRGRLVGRASWNADGSPYLAVGLRDGVRVGHQLEYHDDGTIYAEPFVAGVLHGLVKQFHPEGQVLIVSPFKAGTGIDFWCHPNGQLAEERPMKAGMPSGTERWWNEDQQSVHSETQWLDGEWHGIRREWTLEALVEGFPEFFLRGKRVSKRSFLRDAQHDPSIPPYRTAEDTPKRPLPQRFLQLRQWARRLNGR